MLQTSFGGAVNFPDGLVLGSSNIFLDERSTFELPVVVQASLGYLHKIHIGSFTGVYGGKLGHSTIGRYCSIAPGVDIASDQHPSDWLSSSMIQYVNNVHGWGDWLKRNNHKYIPPTGAFVSNKEVVIGNDVWIGQGVFIKSGVSIGDGAIVAAHSVVVDDVPSFSIVAGVPAKIKKMRFDQKTIERIQNLAWWRFNIMEIENINFSKIEKSIDLLEEVIGAGCINEFKPDVILYKDIK